MSSLWVWPVPDSTTITSNFEYRVAPTAGASEDHKGIDIGAPYGTTIVAACAGEVISSGAISGYGRWIRIDHGGGLISIYGHMQTEYVSVGDQVSAGEAIAEVGSEGISTGPHLHFQIELNGTAVDPMNYVDPSKITVVAGGYNSTATNTDLPANYYGTVEAGGTTVGQRVSGVTPQPIFAFVNIYVGDNKLLLATSPARPNVIQSFEYQKLDGAGETAIFTVFDDNWEEIESALSANYDKIYIQYGYYGTGVKSRIFKHTLLSYNIEFQFTGTIITVETVTEGVIDNLSPTNMALETYNPTEAVKQICRKLGYTVNDENFDESQDIVADNPFNLVEDLPLTYIYNTIIPQASTENEEVFRFIVDENNVAYFKRASLIATKTDTLRTYIYQKGYDSNVIDFSVNINAIFGGTGDFLVTTGYRSTVFDTKDKTQESYEVNKSSSKTQATGDITHTSSEQSEPAVDSSGYTPYQMKNILYYHMKSLAHDAYDATLTIVGDPTISILDQYIRVVNMTDKGYLHHTSGVYWIEGITDSIQGGEMVTTLKLVKNATAGDIDGVEVINPRYIIK